MYIGDTSERGALKTLLELMANCLDLYLRGESTGFHISISGDHAVITDDGPGLPYDQLAPESGQRLAERYLTQIHHTPTADQHIPHVHISTHGVGVCVVNMLSSSFLVDTWRAGQRWQQSFTEGRADDTPRIIEEGHGRGTRIQLQIDPSLFEAEPNIESLRKHCHEVSYLFPGVRIGLEVVPRDQWRQTTLQRPSIGALCDLPGEHFHEPEGLLALARHLHQESHPHDRSPRFLHGSQPCEGLDITFACIGTDKDAEVVPVPCSWVNGVRAVEQGTHVDGLREAFQDVAWRPALATLHVVMRTPQFAGPTRTKLTSPIAQTQVRNFIKEQLKAASLLD